MPTYVYECRQCQKTIEVEQRISDEPLKDCDCGGRDTLKRVIQPTAVLFKGSGFHINDYSGKSASDASTGGKSSDSSEKPKPSESQDATPSSTTPPSTSPTPQS